MQSTNTEFRMGNTKCKVQKFRIQKMRSTEREAASPGCTSYFGLNQTFEDGFVFHAGTK